MSRETGDTMRKTFSTALVLLALAAAAPLFGQKQAPPEPGAARDFQVPAPKKFTLSNGLGVTLVPYGTVPKVTVRLSVRSGHIDEAANQVWLSDLTGDFLTQGTAMQTATEIAEAAARMGGSLDVNVGADRTEIGGDVLSESGPEMVKLIADVVRNPRFPEAELARLKSDRLRQLSVARSLPRALAQEKFLSVLYPDHPYGRLFPAPELLQGYTLEQVRVFHEANFGAARSRVYVVGRYDEKAMEEAIRAAFGDWKRGAAPASNVPKSTSERAVYLIDRPGAVQSTIILGMPTINPSHVDWIPLQVTNALLGGSFSSRITSNIREQKGYTYSPNSEISPRDHDAYWAEIADVTTNVTGPSLKEIFGEIDRLQAEAPSEKELKGIQNYIGGTFVLQNSSRPGIIAQLAFVDLQGLPDDYLNRFVQRVYAVTPVEVQQMTQKNIQDDKAAIVVAGDRKVIEEQVKPYGPVK
jgi:zinc protease